MSAHTPGPWIYYCAKLRPQYPVRITEIQNASGVAIVKWSGFDGLDLSRRQVRANAQLIAAAPELLAVAKSLLRAIDGQVEGDDCFDFIKPLRTAINKAEGKP